MYFPISLCCRSHFTVMLFRQRVYSLLNISFKVLLGFGYTTGARVPCKVHFEWIQWFIVLNKYISPDLTVLRVCSLTDPHKPILLHPCQVQNPVNPADLVKNWRTIKQLKSLNPHELEVTWCTVIRFKPFSVTYMSFLPCSRAPHFCAGPPWKA